MCCHHYFRPSLCLMVTVDVLDYIGVHWNVYFFSLEGILSACTFNGTTINDE